jgi:hypothetical protein
MTQHRAARSRRDAVVAILGSAAGLGGAVALTRLDTEVLEPAGLSAEPAASTVVVAAHDAGDRFRATADYACDGQDDHEEIRRAVKACPDGGLVLLRPTARGRPVTAPAPVAWSSSPTAPPTAPRCGT